MLKVGGVSQYIAVMYWIGAYLNTLVMLKVGGGTQYIGNVLGYVSHGNAGSQRSFDEKSTLNCRKVLLAVGKYY